MKVGYLNICHELYKKADVIEKIILDDNFVIFALSEIDLDPYEEPPTHSVRIDPKNGIYYFMGNEILLKLAKVCLIDERLQC